MNDLFGGNHGLNHIQQDQKRYALRPLDHGVWHDPQAYIEIYSSVKEETAS
jgi:5-methylcytosine-specific restriction protein B